MKKILILATVFLFTVNLNAQAKKAKSSNPKAEIAMAKTVAPVEAAKPIVASVPQKLEWMNIKDALAKSQGTRKKIMVDFITDWCGWCKRMEKTTYEDPRVIETMNKYFLPVKFNAEREEPFKYKGQEYAMKAQGVRSTHEFAIHILSGKLGYPTTTFLGIDHALLSNIPGYIAADEMILILTYFGENKYLSMQFEEFKAQQQNQTN